MEGKDEENKKVVRKIIYTFLTAKLSKTHSIAVMNVTGELEGELQRELKVTVSLLFVDIEYWYLQ